MSYFRTGILLLMNLLLILYSCSNRSDSFILVIGDADYHDSLLQPINSKIGIINPSKSGEIKILTEGFISANSPDISFDGRSMIFSGRRNGDEPLQIWGMDLSNRKTRKVTQCSEDCLFPVYLPAQGIVYSRMLKGDSLRSHSSLFRCNLDGSNIERITFNPASWHAMCILQDGRILAECSQVYPARDETKLMVLRPDGTKAELFYRNKETLTLGKVAETDDGNILITEISEGNSQLKLISYKNPFNTPKSLSRGDFIPVGHGKPEQMVAIYRNSPAETYKLYVFDSENGTGDLLHGNDRYDITDAVMIKERILPKKLPSEVDKLVKTGLLLCQDISCPEDMREYLKPSSIGIIGIDSLLGIVEPEPDGSIYLKILADTPFRLATLDSEGKVLKSCDWMALRPNERRGCTGCHEEPGIVPENRIPMAVRGKDPQVIPVINRMIKEKIVELE